MKPNRLVLFDIDGTLLSVDRQAWDFPASLCQAILEVLVENSVPHDEKNIRSNAGKYQPSGKTDPQIVFEFLEGTGISETEIFRLMPVFRDKYIVLLGDAVRSPVNVQLKPGISRLLQRLSEKEEVVLALLTGNFEEGALLKLESHGLQKYFVFEVSAFGDNSRQRQELPGRAVESAREHLGRDFTGKSVVILGDTPNDVRCGRDLNARSIAVATGHYSVEELAVENPDFTFQDFSETENVLPAILNPL